MAEKPKPVKIAARIPADLHKRLKHAATEREIPLNEMIVISLTNGMPNSEPEPKAFSR